MEIIRDLSFLLLLTLVGTIVDPRGTLVVSGTIVPCNSNTDCPSESPVCEDGVCRDCRTNGGAWPNLPCLFPFNYKGNKYTECTKMGNNNVPWCSTKVDSKRNHVSGNWGNCSPRCPGVPEDLPSKIVREWHLCRNKQGVTLGSCAQGLKCFGRPNRRENVNNEVLEFICTTQERCGGIVPNGSCFDDDPCNADGANSEVWVNGNCNCGVAAGAAPCGEGLRCNGGNCEN